MNKLTITATVLATAIGVLASNEAFAQSTLDTVISSKKLRCGVMMDNPPSGFRNAQNEPDGLDVVYCRDMAKILGAEPEIVETPSPDRIPALVSNRIDVLIASATPTPQRALTVAFTQPYMNFTMGVITRADTGIKSYADLKGKKLGGVIGSTQEQLINKEMEGGWAAAGSTYTGYASDSESYLALQQGKVDSILVAMGVFNALAQSGQFKEFVLAGAAPLSDTVSIAVKRDDQQFLNWTKLFVWQQVASGRFAEVYKTYYGDGPVPALNIAGVDF
jgi:hydroxyproline transporter system substrate-binding protein